jgi:hypothetical protein
MKKPYHWQEREKVTYLMILGRKEILELVNMW